MAAKIAPSACASWRRAREKSAAKIGAAPRTFRAAITAKQAFGGTGIQVLISITFPRDASYALPMGSPCSSLRTAAAMV